MEKIKSEISVIMPAYNCENTIEKAVNSVLNQTFQNFELIIIDDGSTDSTYKKCKNIKDDRIKLIHQENQGPSMARNNGIEVANSKYVMFIDSDDEYHNKTLELLYNEISKGNYEVVIGNYKLNENRNILRSNFTNGDKSKCMDFLFKNNLFNVNWNKIYLLDIIKDNNVRFDKNYKLGEDARFNLEYFRYVNNASFVDEVIYHYYLTNNGQNLSNDASKCDKEVELLEYMYDYFLKNNLNMKTISKKISSAFFYLNNSDFIIKNQEYLELLKKAKKNSFVSLVIYFAVRTKSKFIINFLLKLKGSKI